MQTKIHTTDMNQYIVNLRINVEAVEKNVIHSVEASSSKEAGKLALLAESHYNLGDGAEMDEDWEVLEDSYGEMVYSVYSVKKVEEQDLEIIKKYLQTS